MNAAKHSYDAYTKAVGGTTFDGRPLPTFEELGDRQKEGWQAAAAPCGTPFKPGMAVVSNSGVRGTVASLAYGKTGRRGAWIEGVDTTGRPFECHYEVHELSAA